MTSLHEITDDLYKLMNKHEMMETRRLVNLLNHELSWKLLMATNTHEKTK